MNMSVVYRAALGRLAIGATTIALWSSTLAPARAAERITVTYQGTQVTVSLAELQDFAEAGTLPPELGALLNTSRQVPATVRSSLTRKIQIPKVVDRFLATSSGEFALLQLDEAIQGSNRSNNLNALRRAVEMAGADRQMSLLELLAAYPESEVSLDVSRLESTYNRVSNFVERVQPVLDLAIDALQNLICDCATEEATGETLDRTDATPPTDGSDLQSQGFDPIAPASSLPSGNLLPVAHQSTQDCAGTRSAVLEAPTPPLDPVQPPAPWAATELQPAS